MNMLSSVKAYVRNVLDFTQGSDASGAIDVVVVQQEDGTFHCTPFHVHFSKAALQRTHDKNVTIVVNGHRVEGLQMKLGAAGEVFFVDQVDEPVADDYSTSPLSSPMAPTEVSDERIPSILLSPRSNESKWMQPQDEDEERHSASNEWHDAYRLVPEHRSTLHREGSRSSERLTWGWGALPIVRSVSMEELPQAIKVPSESNLPSLAKSESIYFDTIEAAAVVPDQHQQFSDHPCMSLCGHLIGQATTPERAHAVFSEHIVTFELFREQAASILQDPNLRFLLNGKICPLTLETQAYLIARVLFPNSPGLPLECSWTPATNAIINTEESRETESDFWFSDEVDLEETHESDDHEPDATQPTTFIPIHEPVGEPMPTISRLSSDGSFFRKSLQPTQDDFLKMRLRDGSNDIEFVAHTASEGEVRVSARLYFWPISAKIVIAEIDGAISRGITSGRMLTNLLPIMEKDASSMMHEGAPEFYSRLAKNGYRIVYLTCQGPSRAESIHSMRRRSMSTDASRDCALLPNGPVLLSPDRLLASLEPASVNAQEFKVAALNGLRALFPVEVNPFYAAFGKTYADSVVFTQVGVFPGKVFLVDEGDGRLRHNSLMNFQESYRSVLGMADKMFPPISSESPHHVIALSGGGVSNDGFGGHADLHRTAAHSSRPLSESRIHNSEPNLQQLADRPAQAASIRPLKHDIVASQGRTRSMGDEAYNDVNFWRIRPGYVS